MQIETWEIKDLIPYEGNPRKNEEAVPKMAQALKEYGFRVPVLARSTGEVIDGHLRIKAARAAGIEMVPVIVCDDMTDEQIKAFRISVNRMAELADWDCDLLQIEMQELTDLGCDIELTGFDEIELEKLFSVDDLISRAGEDRSGSSPWDRVGEKNEDVIFSFGAITVNIPLSVYERFVQKCPSKNLRDYIVRILEDV